MVEGRQRQHAWVRGAYEDIVLMGILRPELTEQTPHGTAEGEPSGRHGRQFDNH